jgi:hypothetical protein
MGELTRTYRYGRSVDRIEASDLADQLITGRRNLSEARAANESPMIEMQLHEVDRCIRMVIRALRPPREPA